MLVNPCSEAADTIAEAADTIARAAFENPGDGLVSYSTLAVPQSTSRFFTA